MGKLPATIIIARHGARLDAADKNWHLTSPTPYDPPLSYGGWLQSRALGARIISLLQPTSEGDEPPSARDQNTQSPPSLPPDPRRKRRIIIHTSPYLRCLQTAIAISSGINQHDIDDGSSADGHTNGRTTAAVDSPFTPLSTSSDPRCLLRVDAFLGEWLCPEYFEDITPPPKSERMIAAAKAELLRHDNNVIPEADTLVHRPSTGYFPGGWGSLRQTLTTYPEDEAVDVQENNKAVSVMTGERSQGTRNRAGSYDTLQSADSPRTRRMLTKINTNLPPIPDGAYMPPTPSYAISRSDPIPAGYVAHARDACVKIDYQWDSMRNPPNWGNGGEYGEEWSTMHDRFHTGLERMLSWYQVQDPADSASRPRRHSQQPHTEESTSSENDTDDQIDTVLIIVTHGAGCNAMIGALTGEPAFVDIPTASLTLAVRKERDGAAAQAGLIGGPVASHPRLEEQPPLQNYDLQLVASTDHFRPSVNPPASILSSPSIVTSPATSSSSRYRVASRPSLSQSSFMIGPSLTSGPGSRGWTAPRPFTAHAPRASTGLWGSTSPSEVDDIIPNFGDAWSASSVPPASSHSASPGVSSGIKSDDTPNWTHPPPQRTLSQRGLWGSSSLAKNAETSVKRRWTVTERRI